MIPLTEDEQHDFRNGIMALAGIFTLIRKICKESVGDKEMDDQDYIRINNLINDGRKELRRMGDKLP